MDYKNTISIKTLIFEVDSELFKLIFYLSLSFVSVAAISYQLSQSVRAQAELIRAERVFDVYLDRKKELTEKKSAIFNSLEKLSDATEDVEEKRGFVSKESLLKKLKRLREKGELSESAYKISKKFLDDLETSSSSIYAYSILEVVDDGLVEKWSNERSEYFDIN